MSSYLSSLMYGGYEDEDYVVEDGSYNKYEPEIEQEYVVQYQVNGEVKKHYFFVHEDDVEEFVFDQALQFAKSVDVLVFYAKIGSMFYNPKTGEYIDEPINTGKDYYNQPVQPYQYIKAGFYAVDTDELPF